MQKNSNLSVAFCASYTYDANGNITQYVDADGHVVASYTYDAFGNTVAESGSMSSAFPFRFSTKYYDSESGLYYYGYRFYSPKLGRWLTRDPIEEAGGVNLYGFCGNEPSFRYDYRGLHAITDKTTGVEDCGVIVYATHIGNALELDLSNAKCRKVAFASCMSEQFLPTSRNYGLWNVIDGVPLSPGWVGDTRGEGANAGFGEGLAGFMAYMKSIFAIAKAEAESLCPPDRFLENGKKGQCKQCESYRANASLSRTDDFAFDRTLYNCCHGKSITLVFRSVLDKDQNTWSNILGSGEWTNNIGVFSNSSAKYDCKNKKWSGNKGFYSREKLLPAQSPLEVTP